MLNEREQQHAEEKEPDYNNRTDTSLIGEPVQSEFSSTDIQLVSRS